MRRTGVFGVSGLKAFLVIFLGFSMMGMADIHPSHWSDLIREYGKAWGASSKESGKTRLSDDYGRLPLSFEANAGQTDPSVKAFCRGNGYTVFLRSQEAVLTLKRSGKKSCNVENQAIQKKGKVSRSPSPVMDVVKMHLVGSSEPSTIQYLDKQPGVSNYFVGPDPSKWRADVPHYGKVKMGEVYPGIDVVYYGTGSQLEYDFLVKPGVDPEQICLSFEGAKAVKVQEGRLVLGTGHGEMEFKTPVLYQEKWGHKVPVDGWYAVAANGQVGFGVGDYDRTRPLVIDPVIIYSTYIGGTAADVGNGVAVDSAGCAYVVGNTLGSFITTNGVFQTTMGGGTYDVFVTKVAANGTSLVYSTYLGGSANDYSWGIAVDSSGCAYVTGYTLSGNFPTTSGAFKTTFSASATSDAFVTKVAANGVSLVYSTYLGGTADTHSNGIVVDSLGCAYITGYTTGTIPTTNGAFQTTMGGGTDDAFVTKVAANGTSLVYSTYLGKTGDDFGDGIAVDSSGCAYVTGDSAGPFPTTSGAFQTTMGGGTYDVFVTKVARRTGLP